MIDHATTTKRFVPHFSKHRDAWVVLDRSDGHETPCEDEGAAVELASMCEGARRLTWRRTRRFIPLWEIA